MIKHLLASVHGIDTVVVCVPDLESAGDGATLSSVDLIVGPRGAAAQRNAALDHLSRSTEHVFFFDDDCLPHADYVVNGLAAFAADPGLVAFTGKVLQDGARGASIPIEDALALLDRPVLKSEEARRSSYSLYGCNFAVRRALLDVERFDDRLPLYSWLEDEDLARRLARRGSLQVVDECQCVHLGAKSGGRTSHVRFGYSQVMNPVYLRGKGSITTRRTAFLIGRPMAANIVGLIRPDGEQRRARLRGNLVAIADVLRSRITPERILTL